MGESSRRLGALNSIDDVYSSNWGYVLNTNSKGQRRDRDSEESPDEDGTDDDR